jgi:hypothetical protein
MVTEKREPTFTTQNEVAGVFQRLSASSSIYKN